MACGNVSLGYIRGIAQPRRAKWRVEFEGLVRLSDAVECTREVVSGVVAPFFGAEICWAGAPRLAVLRIVVSGLEMFADVSICAPVSHPVTVMPDFPINAIHICVEPILMPGKPVDWVVVRVPGIKLMGRVSLHGGYAVVKYRGLYWVTRVRALPDELGGIRLMAARQRCLTDYDWVRVMALTRRALRLR